MILTFRQGVVFSFVMTSLFPGGTIVGKTNCEYLCMSGSSWTSCTGPVLNPHDTTRCAGGSSNGNAVLVCVNVIAVYMWVYTLEWGDARI